jgi:hypothetical protein
MWIPPQGFRHAATLLLTNGARRIGPGHSAAEVLGNLADDLIALARDTHADPRAADWLRAEYGLIVDRFAPALQTAPELVERLKTDATRRFECLESPHASQKDIFLIYVPEDRLPIAAPLAIELEKRRVRVAFSGFEVTSPEQIQTVITSGLTRHRGGVLIWTPTARRILGDVEIEAVLEPPDRHRFRLVDIARQALTADELASWSRSLSTPASPLS